MRTKRRRRSHRKAQVVGGGKVDPQGQTDYTIKLLQKTNLRLMHRLNKVELLYTGARALLMARSEHMTEYLPDPMGSLGLVEEPGPAELRFNWSQAAAKWLPVGGH